MGLPTEVVGGDIDMFPWVAVDGGVANHLTQSAVEPARGEGLVDVGLTGVGQGSAVYHTCDQVLGACRHDGHFGSVECRKVDRQENIGRDAKQPRLPAEAFLRQRHHHDEADGKHKELAEMVEVLACDAIFPKGEQRDKKQQKEATGPPSPQSQRHSDYGKGKEH